MVRDEKSTTLRDLIAPEHLLQAIDNSLMHCDETAHRVTGLHFENYTITVHKENGSLLAARDSKEPRERSSKRSRTRFAKLL